MKLSVLIPNYGQHELCVVHLRECMNSSVVPDEIIIVNDGGDPKLKDMLKKLKLNTRVIYARINEDILWGYNGACNLAFWLSRGDLISIEDVDHIPLRNAYRDAIETAKDKTIDRICFGRNWVSIEDAFSKPFEEWKPYGKLGPNQMVTILRRDVYLRLKGQDERFCGRYGYMAYDWASRYRKIPIRSKQIGQFYIIKDGSEPNMNRSMSPINRNFYKENANSNKLHNNFGILNFSFTYEILKEK